MRLGAEFGKRMPLTRIITGYHDSYIDCHQGVEQSGCAAVGRMHGRITASEAHSGSDMDSLILQITSGRAVKPRRITNLAALWSALACVVGVFHRIANAVVNEVLRLSDSCATSLSGGSLWEAWCGYTSKQSCLLISTRRV
jgi:hypothetical protein